MYLLKFISNTLEIFITPLKIELRKVYSTYFLLILANKGKVRTTDLSLPKDIYSNLRRDKTLEELPWFEIKAVDESDKEFEPLTADEDCLIARICIDKTNRGTAILAKLAYPTNISGERKTLRGCPSIPIKC
jgi:hypothetical protein